VQYKYRRPDPYEQYRRRYGIWPVPEMVAMGARFRHGRRQARLSQRQLAERAYVSQSLVSQFERGLAVGMSAIRLMWIAEALGPRFPFGYCPHDHSCGWPRNPDARRSILEILND
jgi:transcriptional regulator with XRE-family HTH domain